jgi:hypothetical protein
MQINLADGSLAATPFVTMKYFTTTFAILLLTAMSTSFHVADGKLEVATTGVPTDTLGRFMK